MQAFHDGPVGRHRDLDATCAACGDPGPAPVGTATEPSRLPTVMPAMPKETNRRNAYSGEAEGGRAPVLAEPTEADRAATLDEETEDTVRDPHQIVIVIFENKHRTRSWVAAGAVPRQARR